MTSKQFAALLGFGFVVAWIALSFGQAVLCLVGAAVFVLALYGAESFLRGEIDLGEVQARLRQSVPGGSSR